MNPCRLGLSFKFDTIYILAVLRQAQVAHAVEEFELYPTILQHQVERGKYNVAHSRLHHVTDVAPVREQQLKMGLYRCTGGEMRLLGVAILVGKDGVINGLDDRRLVG